MFGPALDLIKLDQFPAVAANGTATLSTDKLSGRSIHAILFEQGGTAFTPAEMTKIRIGMGGKNFVDQIAGDVLDSFNSYDGILKASNYTGWFFGDPTAITAAGMHLGDLDTTVYTDRLEIEVAIGAATAPTLQGYALVTDPKQKLGLGYGVVEAALVRALIRSVAQPSAAVTRKSFGIGLGSTAGAKLRKIFFEHANLTSVEFKKGGYTEWDDISIALNSAVEGYYGRTASAGLYVLDRIMKGTQSDAEATLQNTNPPVPWPFQVNLTTSGADTITAFADVHTALPLL